jgi:hypothetical protein
MNPCNHSGQIASAAMVGQGDNPSNPRSVPWVRLRRSIAGETPGVKYNENRCRTAVKPGPLSRRARPINRLGVKFGPSKSTNSAQGINRICTDLRERKITKPTDSRIQQMTASSRRSISRGRAGDTHSVAIAELRGRSRPGCGERYCLGLCGRHLPPRVRGPGRRGPQCASVRGASPAGCAEMLSTPEARTASAPLACAGSEP